jgi:hypothetical protein
MHSKGPLRKPQQDPLVTSTAPMKKGVESTNSKLCWRNGPESALISLPSALNVIQMTLLAANS